MLSYERYDTLKKVLDHNLKNAGYPFDLFVWDNGSTDSRVCSLIESYSPERHYKPCKNKGIAPALNFMMSVSFLRGYDAVHFMANDILEPDNWLLSKVQYLQAIPSSGTISHCPGDTGYPYQEIAGRPMFPGDVVGNCMISRQVYEQVGSLREDFGNYGPIDNDYNTRCRIRGFINYYIPGMSIHLDDHNNTLYGYDKAAIVQKTWPVYVGSIAEYMSNPESCYIPPDGQHTLEMDQHYVPET